MTDPSIEKLTAPAWLYAPNEPGVHLKIQFHARL